MTLITGKTYPVKEQLKALGGRWDATAKGWMVPESRAAQAQALVAGEPLPAAAPRYRTQAEEWRAKTGCPTCDPDLCVGDWNRCPVHGPSNRSR